MDSDLRCRILPLINCVSARPLRPMRGSEGRRMITYPCPIGSLQTLASPLGRSHASLPIPRTLYCMGSEWGEVLGGYQGPWFPLFMVRRINASHCGSCISATAYGSSLKIYIPGAPDDFHVRPRFRFCIVIDVNNAIPLITAIIEPSVSRFVCRAARSEPSADT